VLRYLVGLFALMTTVGPAVASEQAWAALSQGGVIAVLRHARAPGVGDPPGFRLGDCATQRNLSEEGRDQARRIGAVFRQKRVNVDVVLSSRWCRALETARLAFPDQVQEFPALDSFFADRGEQDRQTKAVRQRVAEWRGRPGVLVLVTHQVNITALTGIFPAEGEIVVLEPETTDKTRVIGTFRP
jgi:phosphohistidine phosphatase SixA